MLKVKSKYIRTKYIRSRVFTVNFEHIFIPFSSISIVDFEQVKVRWVIVTKTLTNCNPANIYLFKANKRSTRKRSEIC